MLLTATLIRSNWLERMGSALESCDGRFLYWVCFLFGNHADRVECRVRRFCWADRSNLHGWAGRSSLIAVLFIWIFWFVLLISVFLHSTLIPFFDFYRSANLRAFKPITMWVLKLPSAISCFGDLVVPSESPRFSIHWINSFVWSAQALKAARRSSSSSIPGQAIDWSSMASCRSCLSWSWLRASGKAGFVSIIKKI